MGTGFKGNTSHFHRVTENIPGMAADYGYSNGYFGNIGQGGSGRIRNISSENPATTAQDFYDRLANGGKEKTLYYPDGKVKGYQTQMADGTIINWRPVSSSIDRSPAVDIDIQYSDSNGNLRQQKIHFTKEN